MGLSSGAVCPFSIISVWLVYARERTAFLHLQMWDTGSNGIASPVCSVSTSICFDMLPAMFVWCLPVLESDQ